MRPLLPTVLLCTPWIAAQPGTWERVADMPTSRQEVGVAAVDGLVYVIGGFASGQSVNTVDRYDPVTNTWASGEEAIPDVPSPQPLNHVAAVGAGGELFVIGGLDQSFQAVDTLFVYSPVSREWEERARLPAATGAARGAIVGGVIYVAGGLPNRNALMAYDIAADSWSTLPAMPTGRDHLAAAAVGGKLYAISGRNPALRSAVEVYDPATGEWSDAAPIPTPRAGIAAAVARGRIVVFGGEGNTADPLGTFDAVEEYDPATDTWHTLAPMPEGRHGIGAAAVGGVIYLPGGGPVEGFSDTSRTDAFAPPPSLVGQTMR